MVRIILAILFILNLPFASTATDVIYNSRSATSLNKVILYPDSTFTKHSNVSFEEGELFEVLGQSTEEHEDDSQNQKFKWYKVRSMDGREGWIYGDGLAVILADNSIENQLKKYHKRKINFNNGFENAVMWIASIEGRDNLHEHDYMNPLYSEFYIVITNQRNQSVHINYAGSSAMGSNELKQMNVEDVTGDGVPELVMLQSSFPVGTDLELQKLEVYSMQAGTLGKIFTEEMSLSYEQDMPSPALFKHIEIEDKIIRVEYIDYLNCSDYSIDYKTDELNKNKERCLEYVTYTYGWEERMKMYKVLYKENRSAPVAGAKRAGVYLLDSPQRNAKRVVRIGQSEQLEVIKHYEDIVIKNGQKKMETFLLVRTSRGQLGYLSANSVGFIEAAHAKLLNQYYSNPPLLKMDWKTDQSFLKTSNKLMGATSRN